MTLSEKNHATQNWYDKIYLAIESYKVYHIWESGHIVKLEMDGKSDKCVL